MRKRLSLITAVLMLGIGSMSAYAAGAADGTYTTSAEGKDGPVVVETTFEGGKITSVVVTEQNETPEIAGVPLEQIPAAIVEANAVNVDTVTGATVTSDAIIEAVKAGAAAKGINVTPFMTQLDAFIEQSVATNNAFKNAKH